MMSSSAMPYSNPRACRGLLPLLLLGAYPTAARATGLPGPLLLGFFEVSLCEVGWLLLVSAAAVAVLGVPERGARARTGLLARATFLLASLLLPILIVLPGFAVPNEDYNRLHLELIFIALLFACPILPVSYWRRRVASNPARIQYLGQWRWAASNLIAWAGALLVLVLAPFGRSIVELFGIQLVMAVVYFFVLCACLAPLIAAWAMLASAKAR